MITPLSHSNGCLTQKYINSDFDHVVNVSENMDSIKNAETNAHSITNVSDNMDAVKNVDHYMNDVLHVSGNMDEIQTVNSNQTEIDTVAGNIGEVVQVAQGMQEYQVTETFTLEQGQTSIVLDSILAQAAQLEVAGQMVDGTILIRDTDFTVTGIKKIELKRSYPKGTTLKVTQVVYKNQDDPYIVIDELSAFNRKTVPIGVGADISPYEYAGGTVTPRLLVKSISYVNIEPIPDNTTITSIQVTEEPKGVIVVQTSNGAIRFSSVLAEAFTREEIGKTTTTSYHYSARGGETSVVVPFVFEHVQALYINGIKQLRDYAWEWNEGDGQTITLAEALINDGANADQVEVIVGGEYEQLAPAVQGDVTESTVLFQGDTVSTILKNLKDKVLSWLPSAMFKAKGATHSRKLEERFSDVVNVKDYGAKGDGVTDDTASIQLAMSKGKSIYFPSGVYLLNSPILIKDSGYTLNGDSEGGCIIKTTSAINAIKVSEAAIVKNTRIRSLTFQGNSLSDDFILIERPYVDLSITNCRFISDSLSPLIFTAGAALKISATTVSNNLNISECTFQGLSYGITEISNNVVGFHVSKSTLTDIKYWALNLADADTASLCETQIEYCNKDNSVAGGAVIVQPTANNFYMSKCHFENNGGSSGEGYDLSLGNGQGYVIIGNNFWAGGDANAKHAIKTSGSPYTFISGNRFIGHTSGALDLSNGQFISCIGNMPIDNSYNPSVANLFSTTSSKPAIYSETVNGAMFTNRLAISDGGIYDYKTDAVASLDINYNGYNSSTSQFRNFKVWNGKQQPIISSYGDDRITVFGNESKRGVARVEIDGNIAPFNDNVSSCGIASYRWSQVYAGTGSINTSDERLKTEMTQLSDKELAVALEIKKSICKFRFKDSCKSKGDSARIHFGVGAQTVKNIFERHGLNGFDYGVLCYDSWEDSPMEYGDNGEVIKLGTPSGDRYGIRYDELSMFILCVV